MRGVVAYARALSLPGGGWTRLVVEGVGVIGAGSMFAANAWSPAIQAFGGAVIANLPLAMASRAAPAPGAAIRPLALPTLPLTASDRAVATFLLTVVRFLPATAVALLGGQPTPAVVERLTAAVGILAAWLAVQRFVELHPGGRGRQALLMGGFFLALSVLPAPALPACLPVGLLLLGLVRALDRTPGLPAATPATPPYREHPLDRAPGDGRPLTETAPGGLLRLCLRDGLVFGLVGLLAVVLHRALLGLDPAADLEELRAAAHWAVADPMGWVFVLLLLGWTAPFVALRSTLFPGHALDLPGRANALGPLRWLPVHPGEVWRATGRLAVMGWLTYYGAAAVPLVLAAAVLTTGLALPIGTTAVGTAALGAAAMLEFQRRGPLRALTEGPQTPSPIPTLVAAALTLPLGWVVMTPAWLTASLLGLEAAAVAASWGYLAASLVIFGLVAAWFRHTGARLTPAP